MVVSPAVFLALALAGLSLVGADLPGAHDFGRFSGAPAWRPLGVFLMITLVGSRSEEMGGRAARSPNYSEGSHR